MKQEMQAIILAAGSGSRMTTVVGSRPKCLLPIGNYPMIYYPLYLCQEAGFSEVTVVVANNHKHEILKLCEQFGLKIKIDIAPVNTADFPGTIDSLRTVGNKIKKNVSEILIMSSDLVTDLCLHSIMNYHRSKGAALTMLVAKQDQAFCRSQPPGPKSKPSLGTDLLCLENKSLRLIYSVAGGDYEEEIALPFRMMSSLSGSVNLAPSATSFDAHLYIMKRWLVEEVLSPYSPCNSMDSLKSEVIPYIISQQHLKKSVESKAGDKRSKYESLIKKYNTSCVDSRFHHLSTLDERVCNAYHHSGICLRVNTLNTYWHINKEMHKLFEKLKVCVDLSNIHSSAVVNPRSQVSPDSLIGRGAAIDEKTNISSSVIGNHCRVKPFVKINSSLLMDHVTIEERCVIEHSLICVNIEKPCVIKNSIVTDISKIETNGVYINEILEASQDFTE